LASRKLKACLAVRGEELRPVSMCMNEQKREAGRKSLQVDRNLHRLIWRWGALGRRQQQQQQQQTITIPAK